MVPADSYGISRVPHYLGALSEKVHYLSFTGLSPSLADLSRVVQLDMHFVTSRPILQVGQTESRYPGTTTSADFNIAAGLGCSPFARRYLGNHGCFLFLEVLRCFSSLRCLHPAYFIQRGMIRHYPYRVVPFGNLRIKACLQLTVAFRSLPRPSSAPHAKASTIRS